MIQCTINSINGHASYKSGLKIFSSYHHTKLDLKYSLAIITQNFTPSPTQSVYVNGGRFEVSIAMLLKIQVF